MKPILVSVEPWSDIAIDFPTDLLMSEGLMNLLVVVDSFSKMMHIAPLKEGTGA